MPEYRLRPKNRLLYGKKLYPKGIFTSTKLSEREAEKLRSLGHEVVPVIEDETPEEAVQGPSRADLPEDLESLTVPELKDLLRARDLKVSGNKGTLIERLELEGGTDE